MLLHFMTRHMWGLQEPAEEVPALIVSPATDVYAIGMKASPCFSFNQCKHVLLKTHTYHTNVQRLADIRYNFIIGGDGMIYEGRGWHQQPALPEVYSFQNRSSILIAFVGDYRRYSGYSDPFFNMLLDIMTRGKWYAMEPSPSTHKPLRTPVHHVFYMNTHTKPCRSATYCTGLLRRVQQFTINAQHYSDIRHNFLVGMDGSVYEGRGWFSQPNMPAVYRKFEPNCVIIAFIGIYTSDNLPWLMKKAGQGVIELGVKEGFISSDHQSHDIMRSSSTTGADFADQ